MTKLHRIANSNCLIAVLTFIISFVVYLLTLCPTVYWGDSGEFITVAYTLGVAHPTGYPTYTMLGRLFAQLPFGTVAFRVNLMSAFFASLAVTLLYFVCYKLTKVRWISLITSLVFAFSYTFWSQAVIAEVHTLSAFFIMLDILLLFHWKEKKESKWLYLFFFCYGLTLTNHLTTLLLFPAFAYFILVKSHNRVFNIKLNKDAFAPKTIVFCAFSFFIGLTPYLYLLIRSVMHPLWNWGQISTIIDWASHIGGIEYTSGGFVTLGYLSQNLASFISTFSMQASFFYFLPPAVGLFLLIKKQFKKDAILPCYFILAIAPPLLFAFVYRYDSGAFFLPAAISLIILFGLSLKFVSGRFNANKVRVLIVIFALFFPASLFLINYPENNLSQDYSAYNHWRNIFESVKPGSLIISRGTSDLFIPLYIQLVEKNYLDRVIVESFLTTKPWGVNLLKKRVNIPANNITIRKVYRSEKEAIETEKIIISRLIQENYPKRDVYTTFQNISTQYIAIPYGPVFVLSKNKLNLTFPKISYPYPDKIPDTDGKKFVSKTLITYGVYEIQNKNYPAAIAYLEKAVRIDPESSDGWNDIAIAYYETNQTEKAVFAWERSLKLKDDAQIRRNIIILKQQND